MARIPTIDISINRTPVPFIREERKELIDQFDIIPDSELINNGITSEQVINSIERDSVANYIFSKKYKRLIYQDKENELEMETQGKLKLYFKFNFQFNF